MAGEDFAIVLNNEGTGRLPPVPQRPEAASGPGIRDHRGGVPWAHECPMRGITGKGTFTGTSAGVIGRISWTLA